MNFFYLIIYGILIVVCLGIVFGFLISIMDTVNTDFLGGYVERKKKTIIVARITWVQLGVQIIGFVLFSLAFLALVRHTGTLCGM